MLPLIRQSGATAWYSEHDIPAFGNWPKSLDDALAACDALLCVVSPASVQSTYVAAEVEAVAERGKPILAVEIRRTERQKLPEPVQVTQIVRMPLLAPSLRQKVLLRDKLKSLLPPEEAAALVKKRGAAGNKPYLGADSFTPDQTLLFFGRDEETASVVDSFLTGFRVVALFGPSGAGKSSLVNTKVREEMEAEGFRVVLLRAWHEAEPPPGRRENQFTFGCYLNLPREQGLSLPEEGELTLATLARALRDESQKQLLIFDQFEELFTKKAKRLGARSDFLIQLRSALLGYKDLSVLLVCRKEYYYDAIVELEDWDREREREPERDREWNDIHSSTVNLRPFSETAARLAIEAPALEFGVKYTKEAVDHLLAYLTRKPARAGRSDADSRPEIEPIILSLVCERLWTRFQLNPEAKVITAKLVEDMRNESTGSNEFAIELKIFVDNAIEHARSKNPSYSRASIIRGLEVFVNRERKSFSRRQVRCQDDFAGHLPRAVLAELEDAHLLRGEDRLEETWYELIHDRFLDPVDELIASEKSIQAVVKLTRVIERLRSSGELSEDATSENYFRFDEDICRLKPDPSAMEVLTGPELLVIFRSCLAREDEEYLLAILRSLSERGQEGAVLSLLQSGLTSSEELIRCAAARLVGQSPAHEATLGRGVLHDRWETLETTLVQCARGDRCAKVQTESAHALGRLDSAALYTRLKDEFSTDAPSRAAFARVVEWRARRRQPEKIRGVVEQLSTASRWHLWLLVWGQRLVRSRYRLALMLVLGMAAASLFSFLGHCLPSAFGASFPQSVELRPDFVGLLQSIYFAPTGGILWGITLPLTLGLWWLVFRPGCAPSDRNLIQTSTVIGLVGGAVGGFFVSLLMLGVFEQGSLGKIGWDITQASEGYHNFTSRWSAVAPSRLFWVFPVMGGLMGLGMGALGAHLRCEERRKPEAKGAKPEPLLRIFCRLTQRSWLLAFGLYALCVLTAPILMPRVVRKALPEGYQQKPVVVREAAPGAPQGATPIAAQLLQDYPASTLIWKFLGESLVLSTGGWGLCLAITTAYLVRRVEFDLEEMDE